jgi:hypothetical protein
MLVNNIHLWSAERSSNLVSIDSIIDIKSNFAFQRQLNIIRAQNRGVYKNLLSYMIHSSDEKGQVNSAEIQEAITLALASLNPDLATQPSTSTSTRSSSTQPAPTASENTEIIHLNCYYDIITGAYNLGSLFPEENHYLHFSAKGEEDYNKLKNTIMSTIYAHKNYDSDANTIGYDVIKKIVWDYIYKDIQASGRVRPDFMPKNWKPGDLIPPTTSRSSCQPPAPAPTPRPGQQFSKLNPAWLEDILTEINRDRFTKNPTEKLNQVGRYQRQTLFEEIKERNLLKDSPYWDPVYQTIYPKKK